jgi:hypothetical protein
LEGGKAIDFTVEVGSGHFIPTFEERLIGLKPEESISLLIAPHYPVRVLSLGDGQRHQVMPPHIAAFLHVDRLPGAFEDHHMFHDGRALDGFQQVFPLSADLLPGRIRRRSSIPFSNR